MMFLASSGSRLRADASPFDQEGFVIDIVVTILECGIIICWALMICSLFAPSYDGDVEKSEPEQAGKPGEAKP